MMVYRFKWSLRFAWTDSWPAVQHAPLQAYWAEEGSDDWAGYGWDNVDLYMYAGHGGSNSSDAVWTFRNEGERAYSSDMRLGDDGRNLRMLFSYSCCQMANAPLSARWSPIFNGGLQTASGSSQSMYVSSTREYILKDVADRLRNGEAANYAWGRANTLHAYPNPGVRTVATGGSSSLCHWRRRNIGIDNTHNYSLLRDGEWSKLCYST